MPLVKEILVGARDSNLSKAQVREVFEELKKFYPEVVFKPLYIKTMGDHDQQTDLRNLDKSDFFTREIDQLLILGKCRIAIHSAKDLPDPMPKGLVLAALTKGVDPSDSLVLRDKESFYSLPPQSKIGTSSFRREDNIKKLRQDLCFVAIRGTIEKRIEKLQQWEVDGVVIAEAALIRLNLTHLNRFYLPGNVAPLQGKLAVIVKEDDEEMIDLFQKMHDICFKSDVW